MLDNINSIIIASSISGIIEVCVSHPLDRIKTQMQIVALNNSGQINTIKVIKNIYHTNKLKGFYVGILPRLIGIVPMRLTYWSTMTFSSNYFLHNNASNIILNLLPGLITGIAQSIIDNPIEVIKIKLMAKNPNIKMNIKINNLYQGFGYLLGRNILFAIPIAHSIKTYGYENPFLAGAIGGLIGSIISHPFDVIKTEKQRHTYNPSQITLRKLIIENPSKLFTGLSMRCSLSFVNMGVGFVVFNYINNTLLN